MGAIHTPLPVKLIVGVLTSKLERLTATEKKLTAAFGAVDARSDLFLFEWTHYYDKEMGNPIWRQFLSFAELIEPAAIADAKIATNAMEVELAEFMPHRAAASRPMNLDPGYLEQSKIVLASTKNFFHRILIARGIYAEVTLHYQDGEWQSFPWTFPDYGSGKYHMFFTSLREMYRRQLNDAGFNIRIPKTPGRSCTRDD